MGWRDGPEGENPCCLLAFPDLRPSPSTHIGWLTITCTWSSRYLAFRGICTNVHMPPPPRHTHSLKINLIQNKKNCSLAILPHTLWWMTARPSLQPSPPQFYSGSLEQKKFSFLIALEICFSPWRFARIKSNLWPEEKGLGEPISLLGFQPKGGRDAFQSMHHTGGWTASISTFFSTSLLSGSDPSPQKLSSLLQVAQRATIRPSAGNFPYMYNFGFWLAPGIFFI